MTFDAPVRRPVAAAMFFVALALLGVIAWRRMPVELFPPLTGDEVQVTLVRPGSEPETVEREMLAPLEARISELAGIRETWGEVIGDRGSLRVKLDRGVDLKIRELELRGLAAELLREQPRGSTIDVSTWDLSILREFVMSVQVVGGEDQNALRDLVDERIAPRVESVPGVGRVIAGGGAPLEARVDLDPDRCAAFGVRPEQVVRALAAATGRVRYAGAVDGPRGRTAVFVDARPRGAMSLGEIAISSDGATRLRHVAQITVGAGRRDALLRVNGKPAVGMFVFQEQGANMVRLGRDLRARLEDLRREFRLYDVDFAVGIDAAQLVEDQVTRLRELALSGFVIAILVLVLFLRQPSAVFVVAIAAPVSLLSALALLYVVGQTVNLITLFGLAVSIGMLVDNSIVVYEATQRLLERGAAPDRAAIEAVRRTLRAIFASTLTNVVVFLPPLLVESGDRVVDDMVRVLALCYVVPQVASLLVAAGLVPLLARRLAAPAVVRRVGVLRRRRQEFAGVSPPDRARELFAGALMVALRRPGVYMFGVVVAVLFTAIAVVPALLGGAAGREAPEADEVTLRFEAPGGRSLDRTAAAFARLERAARDMKGVQSVESWIQEDEGTLTIRLAPKGERPKETTAGRVREDIRRVARDERVLVEPGGAAGDSGQGGGDGDIAQALGQGPAEVVLSGPDAGVLQSLARDIETRLESIPEVGRVRTGRRRGSEELHVTPSPAALAAQALTADQVLPAIEAVRREGIVLPAGLTLPGGREIPLVVRRVDAGALAARDLERLPLTAGGSVLPLGALADVRRMPPEPTILRHNGRREITVGYQLGAEAPQSGAARQALEQRLTAAIRETPLPSGYTLETKSDDDATRWFRKVALLSVLLLFGVLAVTFESLTMPALVLVALPLTLIGAAWALVFAGMTVDTMAFVGALALLGLTVNPAILLVDRMQQRVARGTSPGAAALAAVRERVRPVLMTTGTAVAGLWPLALSTGRENEIWPPFATVVMGGMLASTALTLLVVPVGFVMLRRLDLLFGRVGPWVVLGWLAVVAAVMTPLVVLDIVSSFTWQLITAALVSGLSLGVAVLIFRRESPLAPRAADGAPPRLEVRYLHKTYGRPGPVGLAWRAPQLFAERVLARGGRPFDPRMARARLTSWLLLAAGAAYLTFFTTRPFWRVVLAFVTAFLAAALARDVRRARGCADAVGRVHPGGPEGVLALCAPWVAWSWVTLYFFVEPCVAGIWRPTTRGGWIWLLLGPVVIAAATTTLQLGRRTALRIARGEIPDWVAEGRARRARTLWRRFARRWCGLDLPSREVAGLIAAEFAADRGMVGILGPNGAGKTTLLRQLAGILEPSRGTITLGGAPLPRIRRRLAQFVGYLPQDFGLPGELTAREYLELYALLYDIRPRAARRERIDRLLEEVGLTERANERIGTYSGGMRQRVAVARTLLRLPPVIIVDEPTVGLDPRERIRFRNLLARLAAGRIVLFSTHVVEDVAVSCERVIVFAGGRIVYDGQPQQLADVARGQVWLVHLSLSAAPQWPPGCRVVDQAPTGEGSMRWRLIHPAQPHPQATAADPTLEDGYLLLVHQPALQQEVA